MAGGAGGLGLARRRAVVAGRLLPSLGYFGPDDVCINTWCAELASMRAVLASSESASYTFDGGEQGQPAYLFEREEGRVLVSVVPGMVGIDLAGPTGERRADLWCRLHSV